MLDWFSLSLKDKFGAGTIDDKLHCYAFLCDIAYSSKRPEDCDVIKLRESVNQWICVTLNEKRGYPIVFLPLNRCWPLFHVLMKKWRRNCNDIWPKFADYLTNNRHSSYSVKESQSNDILLHFVEFSNKHNCDRSSNATWSNLVSRNV